MKRRAAAWGLAAALGLIAQTAQAVECRLALLLAMDVSSSVDAAEDTLQRKGTAAALIDPEVETAFLSAPVPVALAAYEWSGRWNQTLLLDWTLIRNRADLVMAARTIAGSQRSETQFPTAMGYALGHGAGLLQTGPRCLFQTIDMAGDGLNNEGFGPREAYREFQFSGVTVNGLMVQPTGGAVNADLADFYRGEVLHGPGAFLEVARGFDDYARAMRRKLVREVSPRTIGRGPHPHHAHHPG